MFVPRLYFILPINNLLRSVYNIIFVINVLLSRSELSKEMERYNKWISCFIGNLVNSYVKFDEINRGMNETNSEPNIACQSGEEIWSASSTSTKYSNKCTTNSMTRGHRCTCRMPSFRRQCKKKINITSPKFQICPKISDKDEKNSDNCSLAISFINPFTEMLISNWKRNSIIEIKKKFLTIKYSI